MTDQLILIVEDNERNAKLLRDVLGAKGYRTCHTTTAEEGLEFARQQHPALILMDISLPGMDGVMALKEIRADAEICKTPVIAVTASAMPMDRRNIEKAGFDGYITKPISVKEFLAEVKEIIGEPEPAPGEASASASEGE
jgi:two-component system cell cycle response regulator DivK